jgi:hypothetical protein
MSRPAPAACLALAVLSHGCDGRRAAPDPRADGALSTDEAAGEVRFPAVFHRGNAERGTWHLIVGDGGSVASQAYFTTPVSPGAFYAALRRIGAADGNNVASSNMGDEAIATEGDRIRFLFRLPGRSEPVPLEEIVTEVVPGPDGAGPRGLEMRFGGNYTAEDAASPPCHDSGCLACLYTCSAGVTSNSKANLALLRKEGGVHRYRLTPGVDLPDGAAVEIIARRRD